MKELKDAPFALIGVNSDRDLAKIREIVKEKNLTWRSFQNQPKGSESKISAEWNVRGWPTLVVLDEEMRICYRGHDGHHAGALAKKMTLALQAKQKK